MNSLEGEKVEMGFNVFFGDMFCAVAWISSKDGRKISLKLVVKGSWCVLFQPWSAQ